MNAYCNQLFAVHRQPERRAKQNLDYIRLLHSSEYDLNKDRNGSRAEGTCLWLLEHQNSVRWLDADRSSILRVMAEPVCGKSVTCRSLIDHELKSTKARTSCYFFFKDEGHQPNRLLDAMPALLRRLFFQRTELFPHFVERVEKKDQTKFLSSFSDLWDILMDAASNPRSGEIIFVLDALDECDKADNLTLVEKLKSFHVKISASSGNLQKLTFVVTSRPELDIKRGFGWIATDFRSFALTERKAN
ncbi:hypothetical protein EDB80DRAFT_251849 [Ilyonectria destructans]|nr:hypothetical protein EDB80DRAFT_251849 [Ilyonectria destructans]